MRRGRKLLAGALVVVAIATTSASALAFSVNPGRLGDQPVSEPTASGRGGPAVTRLKLRPATSSTRVTMRRTGLSTAAAVPGAATLSSATPGSSTVTLGWSAPSSDGGTPIIEYRIYRGTTSGGESFLDTTSGPVSGYTDVTVSNGITYHYKVAAVNSEGEGPLSNELSTTPFAPANVPGEPFLDPPTVGDGSVTLTWITPESGGSPITGFNVYRGPTSENKTLLVTLGVLTTYTDTAVVNGTTYYYEVSALNTVGEGAPSEERSATPIAVPGAPTLDSAVAGDSTVALAWSAPTSDGGAAITEYNVYRSSSGSGETVVATLDASVTDYDDDGAVNGTTYAYVVRAVNAAGESARSNELTATPATVPHAPKLDSATAGDGSIRLAWTAPVSNGGAAIAGYRIYRAAGAGSSTLLASVGAVTSYTDAGVVNGTIYDYRVGAVNAVGDGPLSELRSAVPTAVTHGSPSWWDGDCDANWWNPRAVSLGWAGEGAHRLGAAYLGIPVCGPRPGADGAPVVTWSRSGVAVPEWGAAEFVFRFMAQVYGVTPYASSAADVVRSYTAGVGGGLQPVANGTNGTSPRPGDVVAFDGPGGGLAGIVAAVTVDGVGDGEVRLIAQNDTGGGWRRLGLSGWALHGFGQYVPYAWLHDPAGRGGTDPPPAAGGGRPHPEPQGEPEQRPAAPAIMPSSGARVPPPSPG
jgi:fibronectin type 3 domain-containing protein